MNHVQGQYFTLHISLHNLEMILSQRQYFTLHTLQNLEMADKAGGNPAVIYHRR
jgi:hypothetical protein